MYAIVYIHTITNNNIIQTIYPMGKEYKKIEQVLTLKHDVILGSTYELIEVETDVTQYMGGGEAMHNEASVVIPIGRPDSHGDVITQEAIEQTLGSNNTNPNDFPIKINGHTIGDKEITTGKKGKAKGKDKT